MILLLAVLGAKAPTPSALFENCLNSLSKLTAFTVHISVNGSIPGKQQHTQFDLALKGNDALLRVREPASGAVDRSDRSFLLKNDRLVAYDAVANERIRKALAGHDSIGARLTALLGQLDDSLGITLQPAAMKKLFSKFSGLRDWNLSEKGGVASIGRAAKGEATIFRFNEGSHLLTEVWIKLKDSDLDWKYSFKTGAELSLPIPTDARNVSSFFVREAPPKYKSPEVKRIVERMIKAYGALEDGAIDIESNEASRLLLSGRRLREDRPHFSWAFDGTTLSMRNGRTGKFYAGKAYRVILSEYITRVGGEVDPIIQRIISHRVPYQNLFPTEATVTLIGSSGSGERKSDVVEVKTSNLKVSLFIQRSTHLLESMDSETVDRPGHVQTHSYRRFTYSGLGIPLTRNKFQVDPGKAKVLPLPNVDTGQTRIGG